MIGLGSDKKLLLMIKNGWHPCPTCQADQPCCSATSFCTRSAGEIRTWEFRPEVEWSHLVEIMWGEIKTNCQEGLFRTLKLRELWPQILRYNVEKASVTIGIRHIWQIWQPSNQKLPRDQCYPAWSSFPAWWRRGDRWGRYRTSQKYTWHVQKQCQRHNRPRHWELKFNWLLQHQFRHH